MGAQTRYSFSTPKGSAGGIVDLAPYAVDTYLNEEETGKMGFGIGVVDGSKPGTNVKKPSDGATAAAFAGITVNNRTTEYDLEGSIHIRKGKPLGVMKYGRVYAQVKDGVETSYGDSVYLITTGDDAGKFTNASGDGTVAVKARFIGTTDNNAGVAEVELYNQAQA